MEKGSATFAVGGAKLFLKLFDALVRGFEFTAQVRDQINEPFGADPPLSRILFERLDGIHTPSILTSPMDLREERLHRMDGYLLLCFLHGWLKIRDRAKHLKDLFSEVSRRVWEVYHAPDRRGFGQRLRRLREWAGQHLEGVVLEKVLDLCRKGRQFAVAYRHPGGHRTSNMLDRQMRGMNQYFDRGQHLHGSLAAGRLHCRAWALLWNFAPWHPASARANEGWRCPAERLNRHRYHDSWLQNLLVSASLGGYRRPLPQNP